LAEPTELFEVIEDAGAFVAADDLGPTGRRVLPAGHSLDPWLRMAQRLASGPPDPTVGSPVEDRVERLLGLARSSRTAGVLFVVVKFCEPELFYLPQLRAALHEEGLRSSVVEVDIAEPLPQQVVTRIEALVETLT
jgi:benzoyl-CoA reductase/2-hydroxyglutaryl-CoA dehydratase subunit BcrC/BadD/HgdB